MPVRKKYRTTTKRSRVSKRLKKEIKKARRPKRRVSSRARSIRHRVSSWVRKPKKILKKILLVFIFTSIFFILLGLIVFTWFAKGLPNPEEIGKRQIIQSTKIYDRTGETLLYEIFSKKKRTVISLEEITDFMKYAAVATEDDSFYEHSGIDIKSILRATWANIRGKHIQGASTITQQFIKNSMLTPERTLKRKIKEIILSLELERRYSKDEILAFYLNEIPYGSNAYGIEAAAQTFFNKQAWELTLAESALLAALPKAPTYYSPYGSHPEELRARQEYIIDRMLKLGFISQEESKQALGEKLEFATHKHGIKAPHFIMYVQEILEEKYGREYIEKAGLKVYTTLDWNLQEMAEKIVSEKAAVNEKQHKSFNAALTAIDPKTGQVLAMVGSKDYFAESYPEECTPGKNCLFDPNVNVVIRERQPGSAFKPFAYVQAFKKGYTPETILFDLRTEFAVAGAKSYLPQNYDLKFRGPVTMRQALAQSINVPSVKTLYLAGVKDTIELAQKLGITTLKDPDRYGLSLVLGGGEVKLLDIVSAYGVFANGGLKNSPQVLLKVETNEGKLLEEFELKPQKVLESQIANLINGLLSDNSARAPIFGSNSSLFLGDRPAAAKTGTTQEYRDAWTVGYTPDMVAGAWVGNNDNTEMGKRAAGIYTAAPIWNAFMKEALKERPIENFNDAKAVMTEKSVLSGRFAYENKVKIDSVSGKLATEFTPPELIKEEVFREVHNILYYINKDNPQGDLPRHPNEDSQFVNWEAPVLRWATKMTELAELEELAEEDKVWQNYVGIYNQFPPTEYDDIHTSENRPKVKIISPRTGITISDLKKFRTLTVKAEAEAPLGVKQLDFFFRDQLVGTDETVPYQITFTLPQDTPNGSYFLKVVIYDQVGNHTEHKIEIFLRVPDETVPQVKIISPKYYQSLTESDFPLLISVTAVDINSGVEKVEFYFKDKDSTLKLISSSPLPLDETSEYETLWNDPPPEGRYKILARAFDNAGNMGVSDEVIVIVK